MVSGMKNVVVFVSDFQRARQFYVEQLGLPLAGEMPPRMEFFGGPTTLGVVEAFHDGAKELVGRHTGITLAVQQLPELCAKLTAAGVHFPEPLEAMPWGRMAVVADPDGNQFALVEG